ncbi:hypothetical protein SAMN02983003_3866 [Devosia enhydra]|uniref:Uncharacterized protein n=1 Tax=Devosia enhydra TaxID=665118 RepID=A0A1K2I2X4_9HYPH|nr:hypothetical protein [Devosia enhydra]SFZ86672.1 hypothetical protein SAMN02983003_3866 [Devosia enhydra]
MTEFTYFFRSSVALHDAIRHNDAEAKADALEDLIAIWLHSPNLKLRARCASLLQANGMQADMDELCTLWATF